MMRGLPDSVRRCVNSHGISLLEVLIAMALVSVILLGFSGTSTVAIKGSAFSQKMTTAVTLAQDTIEEYRRIGFRNSLAGEDTSTEPYGSIPDQPLFQRTVVTKVDTPAPGLQTITVKVAWDSGAHSTSLSTILGE